jgi:hypothetical protein
LDLEGLGRLLAIRTVELLQIARDALLDLRHAPLHLGAREVLVAAVYRLAFGKQRVLTAIRPLNEAPHPILPQIARESYRENRI